MTVVVTRGVPDRFRGFLASCMCEIAPGVYTGPRMSAGVRDRVWTVLCDWWEEAPERAIVMTWAERSAPGGQAFRTLGVPRVELAEQEGVYLARSELNEQELRSLTVEEGQAPAQEQSG
jgi:CRISPR-associated protein Cas2